MRGILQLSVVLALSLPSVVCSADITLRDTRVLKDAQIVSQTPLNVTIRHSGGLSSVAKTLLPAELQSKYPVDEAAARAADLRLQQARQAAQAGVRGPSQDASVTDPQAGTAPGDVSALVEKERTKVLAVVNSEASEYFRKQNRAGFSAIEFDSVTPPALPGGNWRVRGRAVFVQYPQSYEQFLKGHPRPEGVHSAREMREAYARSAKRNVQQFESLYSVNDSSPWINVLSRW